MFGSVSAASIPEKACGKMNSLSPDSSEATSVSLSAFGTITTRSATGMSSSSQ